MKLEIMVLNYNKISLIFILGILTILSCRTDQRPPKACDKPRVIQKCLDRLSKDFPKEKSITIITNELVANDMKLRWLKSPVKYEQNDLKDIRGLADTGKLYFLISTFTCSKDNAVIGIICINANLGYRFELHTQASGKEVLSMIPELDDALKFRH